MVFKSLERNQDKNELAIFFAIAPNNSITSFIKETEALHKIIES